MPSDNHITEARLIRIADDGSVEISPSAGGDFRPARDDELRRIVEQLLKTLPDEQRRAIETRLRSQSMI